MQITQRGNIGSQSSKANEAATRNTCEQIQGHTYFHLSLSCWFFFLFIIFHHNHRIYFIIPFSFFFLFSSFYDFWIFSLCPDHFWNDVFLCPPDEHMSAPLRTPTECTPTTATDTTSTCLRPCLPTPGSPSRELHGGYPSPQFAAPQTLPDLPGSLARRSHASSSPSLSRSSTGSSESRPWPPTLRQGTCTPTCTIITQPPDCTTSPSPSWWVHRYTLA